MRSWISDGALVLLLAIAAIGGRAAAQPPLPPPWQATVDPPPERYQPHETHPLDPSIAWDPDRALTDAAQQASPGPRRVLETTHAMIDDSTVVRGSCFDWVDAVYQRAGGRQHDVFHGPHTGPFAETPALQPGDWVFFINHNWGDDTHSAIFVGWMDEGSSVAMMVSYAGGHRDEPGRFGEYELSSVFRIVRMEDEPPRAPARLAPRSSRPTARHAARTPRRR